MTGAFKSKRPIERRPIQDLRLDLLAVQWKNHIMWNSTIPQDKKFSTVITKLPVPCSSQSQREADRRWHMDMEDMEDWRGRDLHLIDFKR